MTLIAVYPREYSFMPASRCQWRLRSRLYFTAPCDERLRGNIQLVRAQCTMCRCFYLQCKFWATGTCMYMVYYKKITRIKLDIVGYKSVIYGLWFKYQDSVCPLVLLLPGNMVLSCYMFLMFQLQVQTMQYLLEFSAIRTTQNKVEELHIYGHFPRSSIYTRKLLLDAVYQAM